VPIKIISISETVISCITAKIIYGSYMQSSVYDKNISISSNVSNHPLFIFCNTIRVENKLTFEKINHPNDYLHLIKKYFKNTKIDFNAESVKIEEVHFVRKTLKDFFYEVISSKKIKASSLNRINQLFLDAKSDLKFTNDLLIDVTVSKNSSYLKPILLELIRLLPSLDIRRLKKCKNSNCSHIFIDSSKNNSRIWCSMSSCGNLMKARSFYKRSKVYKAKES
jgi:predicted RNA-binding Zn ribbon-like protein